MKELLKEWNKFLLSESGLSRVWGHIQENESAIISAFRNEYSKKENYERSRKLKAQLFSQGYGVTKVKGSYVENFDTPEAIEVVEQSLFVSNRYEDSEFKNNISNLGKEYEQDSVLFIPKGGKNAFLYGTREGNDFPPLDQAIEVGNVKMGEESEFMSRVSGRPFIFKEELETYENLSKNSKWALKKLLDS
tara:strand:+ start:184 stop:756 length:573 start_codon:yes stop_codon:yes gene_type:complete